MFKLIRLVFDGPGRNVFRGMAALALGSGSAQLIGLVTIPILTRLYTPEAYGILAVFTALVAILIPLFTFRYVIAIPLPRHDGVAINIVVLSLILLFMFSLLVTLLSLLFRDEMLSYLSMEELVPYWWLIILTLIGGSGYEVLTMWGTRKKAFKVVARSQVFQAALGAATKIVFGFLSVISLGLLLGQFCNQSSGLSVLFFHFRRDLKKSLRFVSLKTIFFVAKRYKGFALYRLPSQLLLKFSQSVPVIFLSAGFDAGVVGQFGLAMLAVSAPIGLFSAAISNALYAEISSIEKGNRNELKRIAWSVLFRMPVFVAPPTVLLLLFGPYLFTIVFGESWRMAGEFARYMGIYVGASMVAVAFSGLFNVLNRQFDYFIINIVRAISVTLVFSVCRYFESSEYVTVLFYCIVMFIFQFGTVLWYFLMLGGKYPPEINQ